MKTLVTLLKYLSIVLGILSLIFFVFTVTNMLQYDLFINFIEIVDNHYKNLSTYSGLYKFTIIVCAFWGILHQLESSFRNYNSTLQQVRFVQDDIVERRKKDVANETLIQCNFYMNELQVTFKECIETDIVSGKSLDWSHLQELTNSSLKDKYPTYYEKINALDRSKKNQILITLYRLDAFSAQFMYGNLDKLLAKEIIGQTFSKQVGFLLGIISYFREYEETKIGLNTINLYKILKTDYENE